MFVIFMPMTFKVGDTDNCSINMQPRQITWRDENHLVIEPNDVRSIVNINDDGELRRFTCGDADSDGSDIVII